MKKNEAARTIFYIFDTFWPLFAVVLADAAIVFCFGSGRKTLVKIVFYVVIDVNFLAKRQNLVEMKRNILAMKKNIFAI